MSGGFKIQVYYDPKMIERESAEVGLNCLGSQEIYIQPPVKDRVSEGVSRQAFLHELVHQITWAMGRTDLCHDEIFVDAFAHQMFQFLETAKGDLLGIWQKDMEKKKS
jgi:predicted SprT family Zn-dependent metalloprotease